MRGGGKSATVKQKIGFGARGLRGRYTKEPEERMSPVLLKTARCLWIDQMKTIGSPC